VRPFDSNLLARPSRRVSMATTVYFRCRRRSAADYEVPFRWLALRWTVRSSRPIRWDGPKRTAIRPRGSRRIKLTNSLYGHHKSEGDACLGGASPQTVEGTARRSIERTHHHVQQPYRWISCCRCRYRLLKQAISSAFSERFRVHINASRGESMNGGLDDRDGRRRHLPRYVQSMSGKIDGRTRRRVSRDG